MAQRVGRYELLEEIGRGGMGVVYRARDVDGTVLALKVLAPESAAAPARRARLAREVEALQTIAHPGVVRLLAADVSSARPWLALELIEGESLGDRLKREGQLSLDQALRVGRSLAKALDHCHTLGVLHRDLKPDNVLLRPNGSPVLTDFGLTRDHELSRSALTRTGAMLGTPGYWAPEQARGERGRVGPATDVYGLGATLYALLTGRAPYGGADLVAIVEAMDAPAPRASSLRPGLPRELDELLARCLEPDPEDRPALDEVAATLGRLRRPESSARGGRRPVELLALGVLALGGVTAGLVLALGSGASPAPAVGTPTPSPSASEVEEPSVTPAASTPSPARETAGAALLEQAARRAWTSEPDPELARAALDAGGLTPLQAALAQALASEGEERRGHLQAVLGLDPDHALATFLSASQAFAAGDPAGAVRGFRRAVELEPDHALAWSNLGTCILVVESDEQAALVAYDRALALEPELCVAVYQRGRVRQALGDLPGALEDYGRALALEPDHFDACHYRAEVELAQGDLDGALADAERSLGGRATVDGYVLLGRIHAARGDPRRAEQAFDQALRRNAGHVQSLVNRANLRLQRGDQAGGVADLKQALANMPPDSPYRAQTEAVLRELEAR